jgi:hypothetical protein
MIKVDRQRWTLMTYTNIKEINMSMGTTEELKLTYKFK